MSKEHRVVITGMGVLSPIGNDAKTSWKNALNGVSGIDEITRIDTSVYKVHLAGELKDFDIEDHIDKKEARRMDRFTQYAVRSEEHTSELQSRFDLVCRLLLEKKKRANRRRGPRRTQG